MPLGVFVPARWNDLAVDVNVGTPAQGAVPYFGGTHWNQLAAGTAGQVLTSGGPAADPAWSSPSTLLSGAVILAPATSARNVIQPTGTGIVPLTVRLFTGSTANLFEAQDAAGSPTGRFRVLSDGVPSCPGALGLGERYGSGSAATTANDLAVGPNASATGGSACAVGVSASASGNNSVALGNVAQSSNLDTVAVGMNSVANNTRAVALGSGCQATANTTIAMGHNASASSNGATAIGSGAQATGSAATAIGSTATAAASNCVVIGLLANAGSSATGGVCIGQGTSCLAAAGTVIGNAASAVSGASGNSIVLGASATAGHSNAIVLGGATTANQQVVIGAAAGPNVNAMYIGKGVTTTAPAAISINPSGGSGTDIAGGDLVLAGGRGTGAGKGGDVIFQSSRAQGSASTLRVLEEKTRFLNTGVVRYSQQSTVQTREVMEMTPTLATATDASRKGRVVWSIFDTAAREALRIEADGTNPMIGFLGATAVVRQTLGAAATDAATTQTLANNIRTALINLGLGQT